MAVTAGMVAIAVLSSITTTYAAGAFSDVPADHPFYADIQWMAKYGIADGYPDGTYKPTNAVSRQAAASYLHKYNAEIQTVEATAQLSGSYVTLDANCPANKRPIAGGGSTAYAGYSLVSSVPVTGSGGTPSRWHVAFYATSAPGGASVFAYAVCVPKN